MKFMQAAHHGGAQSKVDRIVVHCTVSPCVQGGAVNVARYFQSAGAGGSAHYTVDPGQIVQSVRENVVAHHAPPNTGSIGVELCDPQKGSPARWSDVNHEAMLQRAARLVVQIAARWDVPLRRLSVADLRAGKRGICGHVDVSNAFGRTDHSDPGVGFPWARFMAMLLGESPEPDQTLTEALVKELPVLCKGAGTRDDDPLRWDVKTVYYLLAARGYPLPSGAADVVFGDAMEDAVKALQKAKGLTVDGAVGPKETWPALLRV